MYFTVPVIVEVDTIWVNGQNVTEHVTAKIEGDKLIITDDRYSQTQEQDYSLAPELMKPYDLEFSEFVLRDSYLYVGYGYVFEATDQLSKYDLSRLLREFMFGTYFNRSYIRHNVYARMREIGSSWTCELQPPVLANRKRM